MDVTGIVTAAALLADPARARILAALLDGRALTATTLAHRARVTPQTTSSHLARLTGGGLLAFRRQGRYRHYRLAHSRVARAFSALRGLAKSGGSARLARSRGAPDSIRIARTCYDHLAGELGVALTQVMVKRRYIEPIRREFRLTPSGEAFLRRLGVSMDEARRQRRGFARQCPDWSERRPHLGGALGAAFFARWLERKWVTRVRGDRSLQLTGRGRGALRRIFSLNPSTFL